MDFYDVQIGDPPKNTLWHITIGDDSRQVFNLSMSLTGWAVSCFFIRNGVNESANADIDGTSIIIGVDDTITAGWSPTDDIQFAVKVTKDDGTRWTPFVGKVKLWDGLGWPI